MLKEVYYHNKLKFKDNVMLCLDQCFQIKDPTITSKEALCLENCVIKLTEWKPSK